jgi:hypothetical protein
MLTQPDWDAAKAVLVEAGKCAIASFASKYGGELCSFFAFSIDYCYGDVVLCFDTLNNSLLHAKRNEVQRVKTWNATFSSETGWEGAKYQLLQHKLTEYNPDTANFAFPDFATVHFSDWEGFFLSDQRPEHPDPMGYVIVLMQRVISELVLCASFDGLVMSSPFRMGVEFPEELGLVVMRFLNWPPHQGPRV